jgi:hypothetical protein
VKRPMATGRPSGHLGPGHRPPPRGSGRVLRVGWRRLVAPGSALPESLRLAAGGQKAERAQALPAVGPHRQEKAADACVRWQGHELDAMALASVTAGKAPLPGVTRDATVGGEGHTVRGAPERVEARRRACPRPLGRDHPPLGLEGVEAALPALDCGQGGRVRRAHHGLPVGVEGREALLTAARPHSLPGKPATRWGGHPARARGGQGAAGHQRVHVAMGVARLLPGVPEPDAPELASQVVVAALAQRLAGGPQPPGEKPPCVGEDEEGEGLRPGKDAVARGPCQEGGCAGCEPRVLGERGWPVGPWRLRHALSAERAKPRGPPCAAWPPRAAVRQTRRSGMPLWGGRPRGSRAVGVAREAPEVSACPLWGALLGPTCGWGAGPGERRHGRSPRRGAAGERPATEPRGSGGGPGGDGPRGRSVWWDRRSGVRATAGGCGGPRPLRTHGGQRRAAACGGLCRAAGWRRAGRGQRAAGPGGGAGGWRGPGRATARARGAPAAHRPAVRPTGAWSAGGSDPSAPCLAGRAAARGPARCPCAGEGRPHGRVGQRQRWSAPERGGGGVALRQRRWSASVRRTWGRCDRLGRGGRWRWKGAHPSVVLEKPCRPPATWFHALQARWRATSRGGKAARSCAGLRCAGAHLEHVARPATAATEASWGLGAGAPGASGGSS